MSSQYDDIRGLERELGDDYETLGFQPILDFHEILKSWKKLPPAPRPYLESRCLWPLIREENFSLRSLENFPYRVTRERASSESLVTREHLDNAMIASIVSNGKIVGFQALLLDPRWTNARVVAGDTKDVKIRITILPWVAKSEAQIKADLAYLKQHGAVLSKGSKAALKDKAKKVIQPPDSVVALQPVRDGRVAIAEGIETAMSYTRLTGEVCWARLGVPLVKRYLPPPQIRRLTLAMDRDEKGEEVRQMWRVRLPYARVVAPASGFNDFNDEWRAKVHA